MKALGLSDNKLHYTMLRMLLTEQMSFSKSMIAQGGAILKSAGALNQEGVQLLQMMNQKQLPLTQQTFQALFQAVNGPSLSSHIQELSNALDQTATSTASEKEAGAVLQKNLAKAIEMGAMSSSVKGEQVLQLLRLSVSSNVPSSVQDGAASLIQKLSFMPEDFGSESWLQFFKDTILHPNNRSVLQQLWPGISEGGPVLLSNMEPKELFKTLMSRLALAEGEAGLQQKKQVVALFQQAAGQTKTEVKSGDISKEIQGMQEMVLSSREKVSIYCHFARLV
ncbi:hypothetical protein ACE1TI_02150 [Alteribacillus sp. JSM 102045]|uniref:hypothetical protein n=1 Tax=Alteribacillus sp. JSM 102045 TaxID=1562101 RepID=UPI0035BF4ADA